MRDATEQEIADYDAATAPPPNWSGFQTELLQSAAFSAARIHARQILDSELPTAEGVRQQRLLRAATALNDIGAVVGGGSGRSGPVHRRVVKSTPGQSGKPQGGYRYDADRDCLQPARRSDSQLGGA